MTPQQYMETEIKLRLPSLIGWQATLEACGFRLISPLQAEHSTLWDRQGELLAKKSALRVRQYGGTATVTLKGPRVEDPHFKIRPETESTLGDAKAFEKILQGLGYGVVMEMTKQRALLTREDITACLDETPFGTFMELEGDRTAVEALMAQLGLSTDQAETRSYPRLFRLYQEGLPKG